MYARVQLTLLRNRIDIGTLMFCDDAMHMCVSYRLRYSKGVLK